MLQYENISIKSIPDWAIKCMSCTHAYTTRSDDMEIKCRCKKGCNFKQAKDRPVYNLLQQIKEDICDNYCQYRDTADDEFLCDAIRDGEI